MAVNTCNNVHDEDYGGHSRHYCNRPEDHDGAHCDDICGLDWAGAPGPRDVHDYYLTVGFDGLRLHCPEDGCTWSEPVGCRDRLYGAELQRMLADHFGHGGEGPQ